MRRVPAVMAVAALFCVCAAAYAQEGEALTRQQKLEEASRLYDAGRKKVAEGDYARANEEFAKAQELLGGVPAPGRAASAVSVSSEAVAGDAVWRADQRYNEAVICIRNEEFKKAQAYLEEAVALNPQDKDAYYNLGIIYEVFLKDRAAASACYLRYVLLEADAEKAAAVKQWLAELKKGAAK